SDSLPSQAAGLHSTACSLGHASWRSGDGDTAASTPMLALPPRPFSVRPDRPDRERIIYYFLVLEFIFYFRSRCQLEICALCPQPHNCSAGCRFGGRIGQFQGSQAIDAAGIQQFPAENAVNEGVDF